MLTLALVVSLLVHLLLLSKFVLTLPELNEGQHSIEVRLVNAQAMTKNLVSKHSKVITKIISRASSRKA